MKKRSVRDIEVKGKRVLLRADFNVPLEPPPEAGPPMLEAGRPPAASTGATDRILDDSRIRATLPTIHYLRQQEAMVIACSHLGRPKGRDPSLSLWPVAQRLSELLGVEVKTTGCCVGPLVQEMAYSLEPGEVLLLENLRFHPQEEKNDPEYARALASLAEVYVNDAFGAAHRAHASTVGVAAHLPAVAGFLMEKEIDYLGRALDPERPYAAVIGGAKISTKMALLEGLLERVDKLLIGGGMANTFLKAEGFAVGQSLVEDDYLEQARQIMERARARKVTLLLPSDVVVADRLAADAQARRASVRAVPEGWRIVDIGETTVDVYARALAGCRTVVWNGPMGVIEYGPFAHGSHRLAAAIVKLEGATTIVGGGETALVVEQLGLQDRFSHVSSGGGASLEFLEGQELPGVKALMDA